MVKETNAANNYHAHCPALVRAGLQESGERRSRKNTLMKNIVRGLNKPPIRISLLSY